MKAYNSYKESGIEWIGKIPASWSVEKIKYVCRVTDGTHFSPQTEKEGKPYITVSNVNNDSIDIKNALLISEADFERLVQLGCQPAIGDVLLSKDGTVGRSAIVSENNDFVCLSSLGIIHPSERISSAFLKYSLDSILLQDQMKKAMAGSALRRITISKIEEFYLLLPSLGEQLAITRYLEHKTSSINAAITSIDAQIEDLKSYRKSIITEVVTKGLDRTAPMVETGKDWFGETPKSWEALRFKYFVNLVTKPSNSSVKIALENIESGTGRYIQTESEFEGTGVQFVKDDIVYGKLRPYLQKVWQAEFDGNAVGDFFVLRCKNNCIPSFLKYVMLSESFTAIANGSTYGAKMPRVSSSFLLNLEWYLPGLEEQNAIVSYLDRITLKIEKTMAVLSRQRDELMSFKQATISEAILGSIDLRDWKSYNE